MGYPSFMLCLPNWVEDFLPEASQVYLKVEDRMRLVIELSRLNIEHGTGGPFGAGIFDQKTKRLLAPGVNMVVPMNCSIVHAEMVAIMIAQRMVGHYDLSKQGQSSYELITSTEPCAMCLGAVHWSGVQGLVCGARDEDARHIGFDEGAKPPEWVQALENRGITVLQDVCRQEALAVLRLYHQRKGTIYNTRVGSVHRHKATNMTRAGFR